MDKQAFKKRTRAFSLRIIHLVEALPDEQTSSVFGRQLLRSGTSVGANYRAACRGKSRADMKYKLSIVEEELDESLYWIQLLIDAGLVKEERVTPLLEEGEEILSMVVSSIQTLRE